MNYIIIFFLFIIFIHFCLYYLNIDIFKLSNNNFVNNIGNNTLVKNDNVIDISIEDSINELKNLNKYIDNGHTSIATN